ncbi:hypothetical protein SAMN02745945_03037 [Peptoclostridium litorale DSM 5388]|uniref:Transposase n=2 Tax=Peptoclostridium litorale TaxID=1557 RepID=A0A069RFD0_PEPLI|nr:hypothetical protein [Peptoclostridium litorale]KDR95711.1 transposase [Peptoclostridium litorale DSM 5388]SIO38092.1 hypothetical protein SAMN02745945_03037 [Peptoclostridium litorale DSM 5388]
MFYKIFVYKHLIIQQAIPNKTFDVGRIINVKANKYGKVEFETNIYSTSPAYSDEQLILRVTANKVIVMNKEFKEIIIHKRIYGKNKESMRWHPYLKTLAKRPNAIKYTDFYNILPDIWKNYIEKQDTDGKKGAIKALDKMIEEGNSESIAIVSIAFLFFRKSPFKNYRFQPKTMRKLSRFYSTILFTTRLYRPVFSIRDIQVFC